MHINTAVMNHIIPLLEKYEQEIFSMISLQQIKEEIKALTGKGVNFAFVELAALGRAIEEKQRGQTLSFNIVLSPECEKDLCNSSQARRDRFRHLVGQKVEPTRRICLLLESINSETSFTINCVVLSGRIHFLAIIGYYGKSINGWAERVGLKETLNPHSIASTHYIPVSAAEEYFYLLRKEYKFAVV